MHFETHLKICTYLLAKVASKVVGCSSTLYRKALSKLVGTASPSKLETKS